MNDIFDAATYNVSYILSHKKSIIGIKRTIIEVGSVNVSINLEYLNIVNGSSYISFGEASHAEIKNALMNTMIHNMNIATTKDNLCITDFSLY